MIDGNKSAEEIVQASRRYKKLNEIFDRFANASIDVIQGDKNLGLSLEGQSASEYFDVRYVGKIFRFSFEMNGTSAGQVVVSDVTIANRPGEKPIEKTRATFNGEADLLSDFRTIHNWRTAP